MAVKTLINTGRLGIVLETLRDRKQLQDVPDASKAHKKEVAA
jgi:hypothetical protein